MEVLKRLKGRAPLMHLKNLRRGPEIPRFDAMAIPPGEHKEVGSGSIDFVAVLRQEGETGVEHYFVEQDSQREDPVESLEQSYRYLRSLQV